MWCCSWNSSTCISGINGRCFIWNISSCILVGVFIVVVKVVVRAIDLMVVIV